MDSNLISVCGFNPCEVCGFSLVSHLLPLIRCSHSSAPIYVEVQTGVKEFFMFFIMNKKHDFYEKSPGFEMLTQFVFKYAVNQPKSALQKVCGPPEIPTVATQQLAEPCCSKCGVQTSSAGLSRELTQNTEPQTRGLKICFLTSSLGSLSAMKD